MVMLMTFRSTCGLASAKILIDLGTEKEKYDNRIDDEARNHGRFHRRRC
jgi:hypothetical protein